MTTYVEIAEAALAAEILSRRESQMLEQHTVLPSVVGYYARDAAAAIRLLLDNNDPTEDDIRHVSVRIGAWRLARALERRIDGKNKDRNKDLLEDGND